ncbi:hypothetical protein P691DRAFT_799103 [Macrolepiota fuliginosa MF-IS2]|uniref:Uncharacterized protein n=1 Tax=Macrolepiota fuliginosa MF-IS2 TaxID=1400762 RepID=A0A9P5X1K2_9AGAR|nr:hypothetical protein P691DRAFT_799103 [Macrolepiota fuliginosa MF-IS2]
MIYLVSDISVARAATAINATVTFVQITTSLSLMILLIHLMPKTNTAITWSLISKTLHSSLWPTILSADSSSSEISGAIVSIVSYLLSAATILVAVAGILLPSGLGNGPLIPAEFRLVNAEYIPDNSPLAYSTTPNRPQFVYGRRRYYAGDSWGGPQACPGNKKPNASEIAPSLVENFNSTPHGPFAMQYRRFFPGLNPVSDPSGAPDVSVLQSFILRNDTFAVEGLIVDMSPTHPGVGFWNQTLPKLPNGGTWSQDVLWLEPVTRCIDTQLTLDYYTPSDDVDNLVGYSNLSLTDHGGFVNLAHNNPTSARTGQHVDLMQRAYVGAVLNNRHVMLALNITRQSSSIGASYLLHSNQGGSIYWGGSTVGGVSSFPISYINDSAYYESKMLCRGHGDHATADGSYVNVECGIFLGPPQRTDGGDPQDYALGSRWSQKIHSCASATRASIQTVNFSTNSITTSLRDLNVTRMTLGGLNVLWAMEKTPLTVAEIDILWGRVDDRYEGDSSLRTVRAEGLYLPVSSSGSVLPPGFPPGGHVTIWDWAHPPPSTDPTSGPDYSGHSDFALALKFQSLVAQDPENGDAQIRNLIWTDMMANNFIGTQTNNTLWAPSFLGATFLLIIRSLTFGYMKKVLNHTSVGRIIVGASDLRIRGQDDDSDSSFADLGDDPGSPGRSCEKEGWGFSTPVTLELGYKDRECGDHGNVLEPLNRD